jgi:hypothetical protein
MPITCRPAWQTALHQPDGSRTMYMFAVTRVARRMAPTYIPLKSTRSSRVTCIACVHAMPLDWHLGVILLPTTHHCMCVQVRSAPAPRSTTLCAPKASPTATRAWPHVLASLQTHGGRASVVRPPSSLPPACTRTYPACLHLAPYRHTPAPTYTCTHT